MNSFASCFYLKPKCDRQTPFFKICELFKSLCSVYAERIFHLNASFSLSVCLSVCLWNIYLENRSTFGLHSWQVYCKLPEKVQSWFWCDLTRNMFILIKIEQGSVAVSGGGAVGLQSGSPFMSWAKLQQWLTIGSNLWLSRCQIILDNSIFFNSPHQIETQTHSKVE